MDSNAHKVSACLVWVARYFLRLWRVGTKNDRHIDSGVLKLDVCCTCGAKVAACAGVWNPGRGSVQAVGREHIKGCIGLLRCSRIENGIGPVSKRNSEVTRSAWIK